MKQQAIRACPYCQKNCKQVKYPGINPERPQFFCGSCHKAFNALAGTPFYGILYIKKWQPYIDLLTQGLSQLQAAKELGISERTLINWERIFLKQMEIMQLEVS